MGAYIHSTPQHKFNQFNEINSESMITEELIQEILNNNVLHIQINSFSKVSSKTYEILNNRIFSIKPEISLRLYGWSEKNTDLTIIGKMTNLQHLSIDNLEVINEHFISNLKNIKSLSLATKNITNYDFLNNLNENLEELSIIADDAKQHKINISQISRFKKLKSLTILGHNKNIEQIISQLENLEILILCKIKSIKNLDFVKSLKKLKYLHLKSIPLTNFDALESFKNLKFIEFYKVENLENLDFINKMESLEHIFLQTVNKIKGFPKLHTNCKLRKIELWYMKSIKDFTSLENLHSLKEFSCREMTANEPNDFLPILRNKNIKKIAIWFLKEGQRKEMQKLYEEHNKEYSDVNYMY